MKLIPLTNGGYVAVDDEDERSMNEHSWHKNNYGYAVRYQVIDDKRTAILMHRVLAVAVAGQKADHRNGERLDNRKENLRLCTQSENSRNRKKHATNRSGVKGVYRDKKRNKWVAQISFSGRQIMIGRFDEISVAQKAYADAAIEMHGEFARVA